MPSKKVDDVKISPGASSKAKSPSGYATTDVEEVILTHLRTYLEYDHAEEHEQVEVAKSISCVFYKSGGCPECKFCIQPSEQVLECSDVYRSRITTHPQLHWTPEFELDRIKKREKVKMADLEFQIGLECDSCYLSGSCPHFESLSECAIDWAMPVETLEFTEIVNYLISMQTERVMRARAIELADGGVPDALLSTEMQRLADFTSYLQPKSSGVKFSFEAHGSEETTKAAAGGILTTIFGGGRASTPPALPAESAEVLILPDRVPIKTPIEK